MRKMPTNATWAVPDPQVAPTGRHACGAKPETSDRVFLEALLYIARTGCPWRDLPAGFGAWDAVYNRFGRWVRSGSLAALFASLTAAPGLGEVRRVRIDSTTVRAHPHAAGARRRKKGSARSCRPPFRASAGAAAG